MRQLSCRFCLQQTEEIVKNHVDEKLRSAADVALVLVSLGTVADAQKWREVTGYTGELYLDQATVGDPRKGMDYPGSKTYCAFRLARGPHLVNSKTIEAGKDLTDLMELTTTQDEVVIYPGDVFQVGGAFVLGPGMSVDYAFRSEYAGHHVDLQEAIRAATGKQADGSDWVYPSTKLWYDRLKSDTEVTASEIAQDPATLAWVTQSVVEEATLSLPIVLVMGFMLALGWYVELSLLWVLLYIATVVLLALFWNRNDPFLRSVLLRMRGSAALDVTGDTISLMTPLDIDRRAIETGESSCVDCGTVLGNIPMDAPDVSIEDLPEEKASTHTAWDPSAPWNAKEYQTMLCYFREFLSKPHPAVGRPGPVCPFMPMCVKRNILYLSMVHMSGLVTSQLPRAERIVAVRACLVKLLHSFVARFEALHPSEGKLRQFKAAVLIFPEISVQDAHQIIDKAQEEAKPSFVARGLMCGEFHAANNAPGLRNPNFYPLRTPYPCLAIRHMVPGDFVFMTLDNYEKPLQLKLLEAFLGIFGNETDKKEVREAQERLARLREELSNSKEKLT